MTYLLRHILSVLILPTTVVVVVPVWIAGNWQVAPGWPHSFAGWTALLIGVVALGIGLILFTASLLHFAWEGRGTLAPWDPPRHLVVRGPYRFVRNPMTSGVLILLAGIALCLPHAIWAATFVTVNLIVIPLVEEPDLEQRFGQEYRTYARAVPVSFRACARGTSTLTSRNDRTGGRRLLTTIGRKAEYDEPQGRVRSASLIHREAFHVARRRLAQDDRVRDCRCRGAAAGHRLSRLQVSRRGWSSPVGFAVPGRGVPSVFRCASVGNPGVRRRAFRAGAGCSTGARRNSRGRAAPGR